MKKKVVILSIILVLLLLLAASMKPMVWKADCAGCGDCVNTCPVSAITLVEGKAVIDSDKCIDCKLCIGACTYDAIK